MKRSQINSEISFFLDLMKENKFKLPAWAHFTPDQWKEKVSSGEIDPETCEVIKNKCGWDICDFGEPDKFKQSGLMLFTVRNGEVGTNRNYCEKIMAQRQGQVCRCHTHFSKSEDIIVRGGSSLTLELTLSDNVGDLKKGKPDPNLPLDVKVDGIVRRLKGGSDNKIVLQEGESITLTPGMYHAFYPTEGACLIGEVSTANDDENDNFFADPLNSRFPEIVEDVAPTHLLVQDYRKLAAAAVAAKK